jgi:hypothetical protein
MTEQKKPAEAAPTPAQPDPTAEARNRIEGLKGEIAKTRQELIHLRGLILNRDPALAKKLEKENEDFALRVRALEQCLHGLIAEAMSPKSADEDKTRYDVIRLAAIEHFKKTNVNPELWKSLES